MAGDRDWQRINEAASEGRARHTFRVADPDVDPPDLEAANTVAFMLQVLRSPIESPKVLDGKELCFNQMTGRAELGGEPLKDVGVTDIRERFQILYRRWTKEGEPRTVPYSESETFRAVERFALERARHPVREYLKSLRWDGVERLDDALGVVFGQHDPLQAVYFRRWMIAAVARASQPGCQAENMLILTGPQGYFKTSFFRELCGPEWFSSTMIDPSAEAAWEGIRGKWVVEWAELESLTRARSMEAVKAFLSVQSDFKRAKWGRIPEDWPRQCVFGGTTNGRDFLSDPTGRRRFWVVEVLEKGNMEALRAQRDAWWAEAFSRYHLGEQWWLTPDEAAGHHEATEEYQAEDPWREDIEAFCGLKVKVQMGDVLRAAGVPSERCGSQAYMNRAGAVLRSLGFERRAVRDGNRVLKAWVRNP